MPRAQGKMRRALEHSRAFLVPVSVTCRKLPREKRRAQPAVLKVVRLEDGNDTLDGLGAYLGSVCRSKPGSLTRWSRVFQRCDFCMDMNQMNGMESNRTSGDKEDGTSASGSPHSLPAISSSCTPKDASGFMRILEFPARAAADISYVVLYSSSPAIDSIWFT